MRTKEKIYIPACRQVTTSDRRKAEEQAAKKKQNVAIPPSTERDQIRFHGVYWLTEIQYAFDACS